MGKLLLWVLLSVSVVCAADDNRLIAPGTSPSPGVLPAPRRVLWETSLAAVLAASALDIHSSWGKRELNPALAGADGTFGARGAAIKLAITGGVIGFEYFVLRRCHSGKLYRWTAIINFGTAGLIGAQAVRNYGVPQP